jgi:regulatory protein
MLSRRELSRVELTTKLIDRGFARDDVDAAVERLAGNRSVDDRRAAFAHVRTASRLKGRGRLRIQREPLAEIPPDEDVNAIKRFVERKSRTLDNTPAGRRKLFSRLLRRGFSSALISKVLKDLEP